MSETVFSVGCSVAIQSAASVDTQSSAYGTCKVHQMWDLWHLQSPSNVSKDSTSNLTHLGITVEKTMGSVGSFTVRIFSQKLLFTHFTCRVTITIHCDLGNLKTRNDKETITSAPNETRTAYAGQIQDQLDSGCTKNNMALKLLSALDRFYILHWFFFVSFGRGYSHWIVGGKAA